MTGAAGFVGTHVSAALKRRGDGVLGLDNFNDYYDPSLKRARQALLERSGVFVVEGDINDAALLKKKLERFLDDLSRHGRFDAHALYREAQQLMKKHQ